MLNRHVSEPSVKRKPVREDAPTTPTTTGSSATSSTRRTRWGSKSLRRLDGRALFFAVGLATLLIAAGCGTAQPTNTGPPQSSSAESSAPAASGTEPTTQDLAQVALEIAIADGRLTKILERHPYRIDGARQRSSSVAELFLRFDGSVPLEEWPLDLCGAGESAGPFTGLHFLIDLDANQVSAVSPVWDDYSCIPY